MSATQAGGALGRGRVGLTVTNAVTGDPLDITAEVAPSSIVVRVGDTIYAVHQKALSLDGAAILADQLTRVAS